MCKDCENGAETRMPVRRRIKLWDLDSRLHCAIVGTCLTFGDLQRIVRKLKILVPENTANYSLHGFFVGAAKGDIENKEIARKLHKLLERNHSASINMARLMRDDALLSAFWDSSVKAGKIPGPFWTILTSPYASEELKDRVYGEVHMLSHIEGATNRKGLLKAQELERQNGALRDQVAQNRRRHFTIISEKNSEIEQLKQELLAKDIVITQFEAEVADLGKQVESDNRHKNQEILDAQQLQIAEGNRYILRLEREAQKRGLEYSEAQNRVNILEEENSKCARELAMLEEELRRAHLPICDNGDCPIAETGDLDLCGRCVVFVGGRSNQTPHFRSLVERYNGTFMHHDGGLGDGQMKLESALSKADVVFFPVDCVSHNASRDIKRFCKRGMKPFVPLQRSGYASFRKGLEDTFIGQLVNTQTS